jgi:hypothetical protein
MQTITNQWSPQNLKKRPRKKTIEKQPQTIPLLLILLQLQQTQQFQLKTLHIKYTILLNLEDIKLQVFGVPAYAGIDKVYGALGRSEGRPFKFSKPRWKMIKGSNCEYL